MSYGVIEAVCEMPEKASLDEIAEQVPTLAAIRRGEEEADAGRVVSHEDMKQRIATWHWEIGRRALQPSS